MIRAYQSLSEPSRTYQNLTKPIRIYQDPPKPTLIFAPIAIRNTSRYIKPIPKSPNVFTPVPNLSKTFPNPFLTYSNFLQFIILSQTYTNLSKLSKTYGTSPKPNQSIALSPTYSNLFKPFQIQSELNQNPNQTSQNVAKCIFFVDCRFGQHLLVIWV